MVIIVKQQVRDIVEILKVVGVLRAGMSRRIDTTLGSKVVEKAVPLLAERSMKVNYRRTLTLN